MNFALQVRFQPQVKWFTNGAEFNTNHEMLIWLWSSNLSDAATSKHPFAALPHRWFPTEELRAKVNKAVVECIAWDSHSNYQRFWGTYGIDQIHRTPQTHMFFLYVEKHTFVFSNGNFSRIPSNMFVISLDISPSWALR